MEKVIYMKRILQVFRSTLFYVLAGFMWLAPMQANAATLTVVVEGLRNVQGKVGVAVYSGAEGFPTEDSKALKQAMVPIDGASKSATAIFSDLAPGTYAAAVFHDDNNSGKLETGFFGAPLKGYGFSNNPNPTMRAARFDEAALKVGNDSTTAKITLIYP